MLVILANILLRQANKTQNARDYIDALITAKFTNASAQGGAIISTSVNGKSVSLQLQAGMSERDIMVAAEMALAALERGLTRVSTQTYAVLR